MTEENVFFNDDEIDALQELMNIAFGQAAAELAEVIDISVSLSFPKLRTLKISELHSYISQNSHGKAKSNIVEQSFRGNADGIAYLIFPYGTERDFLSLFNYDSDSGDFLTDVEKEVLSEVGNILIGACVSRMFDLLSTSVTYKPPHTSIGVQLTENFAYGFSDTDFAIMLKTSFVLSEKSIEGYLFLVNSQSSVEPLKKALAELFESYE
jgi:chemotaxis protein CheC